MKPLMKYLIFSVIAMLSVMACSNESAKHSYAYDPDANPEALLDSALATAKQNDQLVLVVFGSGWCPDCRSLNYKMAQPPLAETIKANFSVMHVDVGQWDKNIAFTEQFGNPIDSGIPSLAIMSRNKKLYYVAEDGGFASARSTTIQALNDWFLSALAAIQTTTTTK